MSMHNLIPQIGMNMICKREKKYLREGRVRGGGHFITAKINSVFNLLFEYNYEKL